MRPGTYPSFLLLGLGLSACGPLTIGVGDSEKGGETDPYADALAPVAVIADPGELTEDEAVSLDGSGSYDPQGYALTDYAWSCDDGSAAIGATGTLTFATLGEITCTLTVTSESGLTGSASVDLTVEAPKADWTFLVFMNGDNDLEAAGLGDFNEMEQVGSTDQVNIVVQFDRSANYSRKDGDWSGARRFLVTADDDSTTMSSPVLEDLGAVDSGDPSTVVDFVAWAAENFPAHHYALVMWDHGWGWSVAADPQPASTKGVSWDEDTNNDISVAEGDLEDMLSRSVEALGQPLDLIGFDACEMASWEVAYVAQPYADVFVGSQDYEGEDGWAYDTTLADLVADPEMSAGELGNSIALRFSESKDSTQSVIDLTTLPDLTASIESLSLAMLADSDPDALLKIGAQDAKEFEGGGSGTDHDMGDMLDLLAAGSTNADVATLATDTRAVLTSTVIANYTYGRSSSKATGLSIYSPTHGRVDPTYLDGRWSKETDWDDLLVAARGSR